MNHFVLDVVAVLTDVAEDGPRNSGPDFGKASPFGLLVIVLLLIGTFLLVWSMNRQLKKVPASFDDVDSSAAQASDAGPARSAAEGIDDDDSSAGPAR